MTVFFLDLFPRALFPIAGSSAFDLFALLRILALRGGIRNNAAAGLHVGYAVLDHHSPKRDSGIKVARESV